MKKHLLAFTVLITALTAADAGEQYSGVYPHLAMYNDENECGTGAVVPWAGSLWAITYAPYMPQGSSDKLYQFTPDLQQIIRPESIGGTPANRMIHKESNQLFIGPYVIDGKGKVRTISYKSMPGRHTGNARHLTDPSGKIYYATMEEGLYSVDVKTLAVEEHIKDDHPKNKAVGNGVKSTLHGYHGKGLYSGQGRVIYSNNGMKSGAAKKDPATTSGALAQWFGKGSWQLVRKNQFTEVTGPGGIYGSDDPAKDPVWAMGWDVRSLLLGLLEDGEWTELRKLSTTSAASITLEVDIDGTGLWLPYKTFGLKAGENATHQFPEGFSAYWVRATSDKGTIATAWFVYE